MIDFKTAFVSFIIKSRYNSYGAENYDSFRFGSDITQTAWKDHSHKLVNQAKKLIQYRKQDWIKLADEYYNQLTPYHRKLETLYKNLNMQSRELLISLIAYRLLGRTKVKLPRNNAAYKAAIKSAQKLVVPGETYDPQFMHFVLEKFDLRPIGYDIRLFFSNVGVAIDYIIEQYAYKNEEIVIEALPGDIVLDVGGCWADTALYFAHKVTPAGMVYSFEFIPGNLKIHDINRNLNTKIAENIEVVEYPVSDTTGQHVYFKDNGPGSKIQSEPFKDQTGKTTTISIDDFVQQRKLSKVNFIKMDIEGAERVALAGAHQTIKQFKPTLAIAIYHSLEELIDIPSRILELYPDYEIFLDHYTIHAEETILFARPKK